jgi:hypothetical protein
MRGVAFTLTEALSKSRFPRRTVGFVSTILAPGEIFSNPGTVPYSKATTEVTPSVSKSFKNRLLLLGPLGLHTHKAESTAVCDCVVRGSGGGSRLSLTVRSGAATRQQSHRPAEIRCQDFSRLHVERTASKQAQGCSTWTRVFPGRVVPWSSSIPSGRPPRRTSRRSMLSMACSMSATQ